MLNILSKYFDQRKAIFALTVNFNCRKLFQPCCLDDKIALTHKFFNDGS